MGSFLLRVTVGWLAFFLLVLGCSGPAPATREATSVMQQPPAADSGRTLVVAIRVEPPTVAAKALADSGVGLRTTPRLFNAGLTIDDPQGNAQPYLAEALPQLNSESWRLLGDGRMETTYRLRPGLTWHDGTPLTAADFVFAWRLYTAPDLGVTGATPQDLMEEMTAPDDRTILIRWRKLYPGAGILQAGGNANFQALPRHILEQTFNQDRQALISHPFWTSEYVALGPYRLQRWEPGAFIEASGFEGHALGRPRIDRLRLVFMSDPNTVVANLLAGEVHLTLDDTIRFQQASTLRRQWGNGGTVIIGPGNWRFTQIQLRPEYMMARATLDQRVRKAMAFTIDRAGLNEALFEGEGIIADSLIPPTVSYYAAVDRATTKYPYDPRRAESLMADAGYAKGADGFFSRPGEEHPTFELKVLASAQNEAEVTITADGWRRAGFDVREAVMSASQGRDLEARSTFPSFFTTGGTCCEESLTQHTTSDTPRADNRWTGTNRGAWSNPEYDRVVAQLTGTLGRDDRTELIARAVAIFSDDLPAFSLYFNPSVVAHVAQLQGPLPFDPSGAGDPTVHLWSWQ